MGRGVGANEQRTSEAFHYELLFQACNKPKHLGLNPRLSSNGDF